MRKLRKGELINLIRMQSVFFGHGSMKLDLCICRHVRD